MKPFSLAVVAAVATIAAFTEANASLNDIRGENGCTFYEHNDGKGNSMRHTVGALVQESRTEARYDVKVRYVGDAWNDRISSILCDKTDRVSCTATVHDHRDFGGVGGGFSSLDSRPVNVGGHWNDNISSFRIVCTVKKLAVDGRLQDIARVDPRVVPGMRRIESVNGKTRNLELTTGETLVIRGRGFSVPGRDALQGWVTGAKSGGIYLHISDVTDTKIVARLTGTNAARTLWNRNERQSIRVLLRGDGWGRDVSFNLPDSVYYCVPDDRLCQ